MFEPTQAPFGRRWNDRDSYDQQRTKSEIKPETLSSGTVKQELESEWETLSRETSGYEAGIRRDTVTSVYIEEESEN